jgi:FkbM family methyltransferase
MVVDCGANIGMSVLYFKYFYPNARILAFEPGRDAFQLLQRNVQANGLNNVQLEPKAVGMQEGKASFFVDPNISGGTMNSLVPGRLGGVTTEDVDVVRLSNYITGPVDLLKIDIEGGEQAVLNDLLSTNAISNVRQLVMEYHQHVDQTPSETGRLLDQLRAVGFDLEIVEPQPFPLVPTRGRDRMIWARRSQD